MRVVEITVVIAVYNRCSLTEHFLKTITSQSFNNYQIVVIDDGSIDGTYEMIEQNFPKIHLIRGDGNLWWSGATNVGVKYAMHNFDTKYICTMNDDTEVDYYFIEELYKAAQVNSKAIVGCFSYDIKNRTKLVYNGSRVDWWTGKISTVNQSENIDSENSLIPVTYYIGRGVLIPSQVFIDCGFYDEVNFPQSLADNDLIFRAKRLGYSVYAARNARQYIYTDESKHLKLKMDRKITSFIKYLFINQGGGNVLTYTKYIIRNYPWYGIPSALLNGILSRTLGYWKPINQKMTI